MVTFTDSIISRRRIISFAVLFPLCWALSPIAYSLERQFVTIKPQVERSYSQEELFEIAHEPSQKHNTKDGYVANPAMDALFSEMVYRTTGGDGADLEIPFRLHIPFQRQPECQRSLIVVFHGVGESDDDNARQLSHLHYGIADLVGSNGLESYILATQCPSECAAWESADNRYGVAPLDYTLEIIGSLLKEYAIPREQVVALGICSGANTARQVAQEHPDLFCAQILCGFAPLQYDINTPFSLPTWAFNNAEDGNSDIELVRTTFEAAKKRGDSVWLSERSGVHMHDSWSRALRDDHALAWLAANASTSFAPPPPGCKVVRKTEALPFGLTPIILIAVVLSLDIYLTRRKRNGASSL